MGWEAVLDVAKAKAKGELNGQTMEISAKEQVFYSIVGEVHRDRMFSGFTTPYQSFDRLKLSAHLLLPPAHPLYLPLFLSVSIPIQHGVMVKYAFAFYSFHCSLGVKLFHSLIAQ